MDEGLEYEIVEMASEEWRMEDIREMQMELERNVQQADTEIQQIIEEYQKLRDKVALIRGGNYQPSQEEQIQLNQQIDQLTAWIKVVLDFHEGTIKVILGTLVNIILSEIETFRANQAQMKTKIDEPETTKLEKLENCCRKLGHSLQFCLKHIVTFQKIYSDEIIRDPSILNQLQNIYQAYVNIFYELVEKTLVVEMQPPQVLMKDKIFSCKLRHLASDSLTIHQHPFETTITLITSDTARSMLNGNNNLQIKESGEIEGSKSMSTFIENTKNIVIAMDNLKLTKTARNRGRIEIVTNEKLCMVFRSFIPVQLPFTNKVKIVAQTYSLPVVVITHGKQEADAEGTIFWDNAFSQPIREPFVTAQSVKLYELLDRLNLIWMKKCAPSSVDAMDLTSQHGAMKGRGLDNEARKHLTNKLLGNCNVDERTEITRFQFQERNMCDSRSKKNCSFWKYFYEIMKLVSSDYVKPYWNKGYIKGFVDKDESETLLESLPAGTFLFRFSNSMLGAMSISLKQEDQNESGMNKIINYQPDTIKSFREKQTLPEIVMTIKTLKFLYPNGESKESLFPSNKPRQRRTHASGYVPRRPSD